MEGPPHFVVACSCSSFRRSHHESSFWRSQNLCISSLSVLCPNHQNSVILSGVAHGLIVSHAVEEPVLSLSKEPRASPPRLNRLPFSPTKLPNFVLLVCHSERSEESPHFARCTTVYTISKNTLTSAGFSIFLFRGMRAQRCHQQAQSPPLNSYRRGNSRHRYDPASLP